MAAGSELVVVAVQRFQTEVPSLAKLKLVVDLELTSGGLTAPAASERYRIEVPGPKVSEGEAEDARLRLTIPKSMFALLAEEGSSPTGRTPSTTATSRSWATPGSSACSGAPSTRPPSAP